MNVPKARRALSEIITLSTRYGGTHREGSKRSYWLWRLALGLELTAIVLVVIVIFNWITGDQLPSRAG